MRPGLPATLAGLCLLLGGAIVYESLAPLAPFVVTVSSPPARSPRIAPPPAYAPPPEDQFAEINTRPLFSPDRKPLADTNQAAAGAPSDLALVGVIIGGEHSVALFRSRNGSASTSAVVGGTVNGWRVARIDPTAVTLRGSGGDFVVNLEGPSDRPPSAALPTESTAVPTAEAPVASRSVPVLSTAATPPPAPTQPLATSAGTAPTRPNHPTIAPEALKGVVYRDPVTGEPTL